jgi:hypothetical protein
MTAIDPAAARDHLPCSTCGSWTRRDLAATGDVLRCSSCAAALVEHQVDELAKVCPLLVGSPIINRTVFRSASLRRATPTTSPNP